jgi:hypothetical protein
MTDHAELIERLRRVSDCDGPAWTYDEISDAAAAIAALVAERDGLAFEIEKLRGRSKMATPGMWRPNRFNHKHEIKAEGNVIGFVRRLEDAFFIADCVNHVRAALAQGGEKP